MLIDELNTINNLYYNNTNSYKTIQAKANELLKIFKNKSLKTFKQKDIEKYLKYLKLHNNANATINAKLAYLSKCLKYNSINLIIPYQKIECKEKTIISYTDFLKYLNIITNTEILQFIKIAFYTGLRANEILNIRQQHINYDEINNIFLLNIYNTKNHHNNFIPLNKKLNDTMRYFEEFTIKYTELHYQLKKLGINAHLFRHSFITRCFEKGLDTFTVMKLVNQNSIQSTKNYVHLRNKFLAEVVQQI